MKRTILLFLSILLLLSMLSGCEKSSNETEGLGDVTNSSQSSEVVENDNSDETSDDNNKIDLMYTFKDPGKPVAFDYPNLKSIEEGTSQVFKNSKYVIVYCRDSGEAELASIPTTLAEKFSNVIDSHIEGSFSSFDISKTQEIKVNGVDVLSVKGSVVSKYDDESIINLPLCGYTFAKDGTMYELLSVLSEETNDVNQNEMEETIEAMINTLREDR